MKKEYKQLDELFWKQRQHDFDFTGENSRSPLGRFVSGILDSRDFRRTDLHFALRQVEAWRAARGLPWKKFVGLERETDGAEMFVALWSYLRYADRNIIEEAHQ